MGEIAHAPACGHGPVMALIRKLSPLTSLPYGMEEWLTLLRESYFTGVVSGGTAAATGTGTLYGGAAASF
jgi:hypothetical protein